MTCEGVQPAKITGERHVGVTPPGIRSPVRLPHRERGMGQTYSEWHRLVLDILIRGLVFINARLAPVDSDAAVSQISDALSLSSCRGVPRRVNLVGGSLEPISFRPPISY